MSIQFDPPERKLNPSISQWTVQALGRLALIFATIVGILILVGGEQRFGSPSLSAALSYPGAPDSWGVVALVAGLSGLVASYLGRPLYVWWSLMLLSTWATFFAFSFIESATRDPGAATTGVAVYAYVAVSSLILGVAHRDARGS